LSSKSSKALFNGSEGTASIEFISNNNRPVANDDFITTMQGSSVVLDLLSNDSAPPGMFCTYPD
jgi:hypothetical protein